MKKHLGALFGLALGLASPAKADYIVSTPTVAPTNGILQIIKSGTLGGNILPWMNLVDTTGTPIGTAGNPLAFTFGSGALLPAFASTPTFNCGTGCTGSNASVSTTGATIPGSATYLGVLQSGNLVGLTGTGGSLNVNITGGGGSGGTSSNFGSAFPSTGTALGVSNGTNMIALTLGQAVAGLSLPVVLPAAQITALTPPTSVGISGTLPAFASPPTIANTSFGISGSLPAFASTPTVNLGTIGSAATQTTAAAILSALGSPFQAGGSIANTSFAATQATASALNATVVPGTIASWGLMSGTTPGTAPTNTQVIGGIYNSSAPAPSTGQTLPLQLTSAGSLHTTVDNTLSPGSAVSASSSPVVVASDQAAIAVKGNAANGAAVSGNPNLVAGSDGTDVRTVATDTSGHILPTSDPCTSGAKLNFSFSQTSSGTIITGTSGKKNYICSIHYIASAAANVSLVEYSGACTGGTAYVLDGSSTAANGPGYAANGGITLGNGGASVLTGAGNTNSGYNVCALQNGSATVAGGGTYVQQ